MTTGELQLELESLPHPQTVPYEVRVRYRPNQVESLGFVQPDANQSLDSRFSFDGRFDAPNSYYYGLGLSFAYLDPPRCEEAIPWLIKAVEKDPAYYNPAWEGFKVCPTDNAPPTPLPTPTPLPEEANSS